MVRVVKFLVSVFKFLVRVSKNLGMACYLVLMIEDYSTILSVLPMLWP